MQLPQCCRDDAKKQMAAGTSAGAAMVKAMSNHKAGKHDADGDDDGDGSKDAGY